MPAQEIAALVQGGPLVELIRVLVDAAAEEQAVDLEDLAMRLADEPRALLRQLSIASDTLEEEVAARTIDDTLRWLRDRHLKRREKEITTRLRDPSAGEDEKRRLLEERQQLLQQKRRSTQRSPVAPAPMGPPH